MKKITLFILIIILSAILIGCGGGGDSSSSDYSYTSVNLTLKNNNEPISNTNIKLYGPQEYSGKTNDIGNVQFSYVQTGDYTLNIDGYDYTKSITFTKEPYNNVIDISKTENTITLMFYANSYNLDNGLTKNLKEFYNYGSTEKVNICVFYKLSDNVVYRGKIEKNTSGDIHYGLTKIGSADFGDPNNLENFIKWAKNNYPADTYILDLWNHGSGWTPGYDTKAINHEKGDSCLEIHELKEVTVNKGIKVLLTDACMMQYMEVLTAVKDNFSYIVASENSIPGNGYNYTNLLTYLNKYELLTGLKKFCKEQIEDEYWDYINADIQLTDLSQIDSLNNIIKDISDFLVKNKTTYSSEIHSAVSNTPKIVNYGADLEIFINELNSNIDNNNFKTLVKNYKSIKKSALLFNSTKENALGFEVNLPNINTYNYYFKIYYPKTDFAKETSWDKFLESL